MTDPRIIYAPHPDITPEAELSALAAVYKFVLAKKEGGPDQKAALNDTKEGLNGSCRKTSIPK